MSKLLSENKDELLELLSIYYTARIDVKNWGKDDNSIEIIENSDSSSIITYPEWFNKDHGTGMVIQSKNLSLDFKIKCINEGTLNLGFITLDISDHGKNRFPIYLDYTSIIINGKEYLKENKLIWHDEAIRIKRKVKNKELITVHVEWQPFNPSSKYENKTITKLNKEIEALKNENKEKIEKLKNENKELKRKLSLISNSNLLEIRKIKKEL